MRWIPAGGLVAVALWSIYGLLQRSADPGFYYQYFRNPQLFVYPAQQVAEWGTAIAVEAALACFVVMRVPKRSRIAACLIAALVLGSGFVAMLPLAMHAPPYYGAHLVWLLFGAGWLVVAAIVLAIVRVARRSVTQDGVERVDERD